MASAGRIEREVKLESKQAVALDRLGGEPLARRSFVSTYHDTPDRLLGRCGITLHRRLENGRNEWQLDLPVDGARREVGAPGAPGGPPPEIADLLAAFVHTQPLVPLATLRTSREGVLVRTTTGIAEVVSDDVAVLDGQSVTGAFGEVEIELIAGDPRALHDIERAVRRLGARRTDGRTTMARALPIRDVSKRRPKTDPDRICLYFAQRYVDLLAADPGVRLGLDAEPVHDLRVAVRRLRALLRAARTLFVGEWADDLRGELDWLGRALGPVRDLDVLSAYLRTEADTLDDGDRARLEPVFAALDADRAGARADGLVSLGSRRYFALLEVLAAPPELAQSDKSLKAVAAAQLRKLQKTMAGADADASDELLHKARIRGKRLRYLAEALDEPRVVRRAKAFQDIVGEHQDAVVAEQRLRALAERVPEAALSLGVLVERQRERRVRTRGDLPKAWKRLRKAAAGALA